MKKSIVLLLIIVVLGFSGCVQKTGENTAVTNNEGTGDNLTTSTATISSDIESISKEVAGIDTNTSENTITPLTEADLTID
ncbi:MAG: hypothetical protein Q7J35_17375 [Candidatus Methanoperedens sp.]|nr:hypothetical protein [Candidatus Methanoperedens sp.]